MSIIATQFSIVDELCVFFFFVICAALIGFFVGFYVCRRQSRSTASPPFLEGRTSKGSRGERRKRRKSIRSCTSSQFCSITTRSKKKEKQKNQDPYMFDKIWPLCKPKFNFELHNSLDLAQNGNPSPCPKTRQSSEFTKFPT